MSDTAFIVGAIAANFAPTIMAFGAFYHAKKTHRIVNSRFTEWKQETRDTAVAAATAAYNKGMLDTLEAIAKDKTEVAPLASPVVKTEP